MYGTREVKGKIAMKVPERLALLKKIYNIHDAYVSEEQWICRDGCATCCTCNVTATTLEGLLVVEHLIAAGQGNRLDRITSSAPEARFQPKITLNQMVALCVQGQALPDETHDPSAGNCHLREGDLCAIYPVRPFGCRAMLSTIDCAKSGEAQVSTLMLSVNNVIMQYLEAVDLPGGTGNFIDVLGYLADDTHRQAYMKGHGIEVSQNLLSNRPFPVLMVPPEHRQTIQPLIQTLKKAVLQFQ